LPFFIRDLFANQLENIDLFVRLQRLLDLILLSVLIVKVAKVAVNKRTLCATSRAKLGSFAHAGYLDRFRFS
jgi:hypothetical protein